MSAPTSIQPSGLAHAERSVRPIVPIDHRTSHSALRAAWLVRVRSSAVGGQLLAIAVAEKFLDFDIPTLWLVALCGGTMASNVLLARRVRRGIIPTDRLVAGMLLLDTFVLTGLLYGTGGPSNPFSILYLVQITVAAIVLGSRWTWIVTAVSILGYAALFALPHTSLDAMRHGGSEWPFPVHLVGMGVALSTAAGLTAYFVTRLSTALEERDAQLAAIRERTARQERLAALTTLAAGAAHELATPMSTIAVTARELEHVLARPNAAGIERLRDDARLIRAEVDRCARILHAMAPGFRDHSADAVANAVDGHLVEAVLRQLAPADARRVRVTVGRARGADIARPAQPLVSSVVNLLRNALDATPGGEPIVLSLDITGGTLGIRVRDHGSGMAPGVIAHAGEPFFTTKPPGRGLGLGLFLTRTIAEQLGGRLVLESHADGTSASLEIPLEAAQTPERAHVT